MAYLVNTHTNIKHHLLSHHTFGRRSEVVDTCISKPEISKIHAAIEWAGQTWKIRNFGRNGTWIDKQKIVPETSQTLEVGQTIRFADPECDGWRIDDLSPPCEQVDDEPQTTELQPLTLCADQCVFNFEVSLDEEFVNLTIGHSGHTADLGGQAHHYLLLHLLRIKAQHIKDGLHPRDQGWTNRDQVARDLGADSTHINTLIFRARKKLARAFPNMIGLEDLLEARPGSIRFNCPLAIITKGENIDTVGKQ